MSTWPGDCHNRAVWRVLAAEMHSRILSAREKQGKNMPGLRGKDDCRNGNGRKAEHREAEIYTEDIINHGFPGLSANCKGCFRWRAEILSAMDAKHRGGGVARQADGVFRRSRQTGAACRDDSASQCPTSQLRTVRSRRRKNRSGLLCPAPRLDQGAGGWRA